MIFQVACTVFTGLVIVALDMWRIAAFCLLAGFFDVLRGQMQRLGWSKTDDLKTAQLVMVRENRDRLHETELIDCVKFHVSCLKYIKKNSLINIANAEVISLYAFQVFSIAREYF